MIFLKIFLLFLVIGAPLLLLVVIVNHVRYTRNKATGRDELERLKAKLQQKQAKLNNAKQIQKIEEQIALIDIELANLTPK